MQNLFALGIVFIDKLGDLVAVIGYVSRFDLEGNFVVLHYLIPRVMND